MLDNKDIHIKDLLSAFRPITLEEMDSVKLMNRIDTKYVTSEAVLQDVLRDAAEAGYRVLVTENSRVNPYDSLYYDTPALKMFADHHNRRLTRQKVRTRTYVTSGITFLELFCHIDNSLSGRDHVVHNYHILALNR